MKMIWAVIRSDRIDVVARRKEHRRERFHCFQRAWLRRGVARV